MGGKEIISGGLQTVIPPSGEQPGSIFVGILVTMDFVEEFVGNAESNRRLNPVSQKAQCLCCAPTGAVDQVVEDVGIDCYLQLLAVFIAYPLAPIDAGRMSRLYPERETNRNSPGQKIALEGLVARQRSLYVVDGHSGVCHVPPQWCCHRLREQPGHGSMTF